MYIHICEKGAVTAMPAAATARQPCYLRSEQSPAFAKFCRRVYGEMLNQYGTADMRQIDLLLDGLELTAHSRVLDAGCGTGHMTAHLAARTGASFLGLDISEPSIARARELARTAPQRLRFEVGSMDALDLAPSSFDAVVAIDSLYFAKSLENVIAQFRSVLVPSGRMALFYTHMAETPGGGLGVSDTKLGSALRACGIPFRAQDLTEEDRAFWRRSRQVAEELREEFEAECNSDLTRIGEADAVLGLIEQGRHARYLYLAEIP
jgi:SAM-dependent methyltransferase